MKRNLAVLFLAFLILVTGCSMPQGMNASCEWPTEQPAQAQLDQWALVADVKVAEELAMRYADAHAGSPSEHSNRRSECEAKLFGTVAQAHGVRLTDVASARRQLDVLAWDSAVHLPILVAYVVTLALFAPVIRRRFPHDEKAAAALATIFVSLVVGGVFVAVGHLWHGVVEMMRLGNTHMSYRAERLGWRDISPGVFAVGVAGFWCAVLACYRFDAPENVAWRGLGSGE